MTIERWTDDKLDELATSVVELRASVTETRVTAEALLQTAIIHQQGLETSQRNFEIVIAQIQNLTVEIRGLQTENRRILDHLFGEQNNNE